LQSDRRLSSAATACPGGDRFLFGKKWILDG
jgi:hypothetical protein